MTARYYGLNRGDLSYVAEGSSTTSKGLEVVVAVVADWNRNDVLVALDKIKRHILSDSTSDLPL